MQPLPDSETAVSELIGALVLIGIISFAVVLAGVALISQPQQQKLPALNIVISNNSQVIRLYHNGGDPLHFDEMKILLDGVEYTPQFKQNGVAGWNIWSVGQSLEYTVPAGQPLPSAIQVLYIGATSNYILASSGEWGGSALPVPPPSVTGIAPDSAPTDSVVDITNLAGSGFFNSAAVKLSRAGFTDIPATSVTVVSPTRITCRFDLTGSAVGRWDVVVTNPSGPSGTFANGFSITAASPPVASLTGTPLSGPVPLDVAFTDASTHWPTTWSWTFGDGNTSSAKNPSNTYLAPGYYTVTLTASNDAGSNTSTKTNYIFAYSPVGADFIGTPASGIRPLTVSFSDVSTGSPTSWYWVFGDIGPANTSTLKNPAHTYSAVGNYSVNLTSSNAFNSSFLLRTNYITVNTTPPVADFLAFPTSGVAPLTVSFNDTSTGSPTSWLFDFGDIGAGNTSTFPDPIHVYTSPGTYTVSLAVSNAGGSNATVRMNLITVTGVPAPAITSIAPNTGLNTTPISITDLLGTNFQSGATVRLNRTGYADIAGTGVTVVLPTRITCTFDLTNKAPGQWNVVVTNPDGQSGVLANGFTIATPAPTVTSITPNTGLNTSTISITDLAGTYFLSGPTVRLNRTGYADIAGTGVTVVLPTRITCTFDLTNKKAGLWNVAVTNADGKSGVLANGFTITAPRRQMFYDNFEAGFTGWTTSGSVTRMTTAVPKNQTASIRVRNTGSMQRTIPTTGYSNIDVTFAMAATGLDAGEYVEAAWYSGSVWTVLKQITFTGGENDNTLRYYSYTLPAGAANNANFALRFRIAANNNLDIGYIDDVWVFGTPS